MQISKLNYKSSSFPDVLREIASPPKQLFLLGNLPKTPCVAIVGSRGPSTYGEDVTYRLSYELAGAGITIVSGLAMGIDAIAHAAAIEAGGRTIAVQACGLDMIHPAINRELAIKVLASGAIISEYEAGTPALKQHFIARNRLIAGLSLAVIVTEATAKSGALYTANFALEQNRLVMAVPGNITSPRSAGPNNLIKSGAIPITDSSDVLAMLDYKAPVSKLKPVKAEGREEIKIVELLCSGVSTTEELILKSGMTASDFANVITLMEITGKVRNLGAGCWVLR